MNDTIRVSILQADIVWENKQENLSLLKKYLSQLHGATDIIVLPEMFSTGFSVHNLALAEANTENTITTLKEWCAEFHIAICGSYMARDGEKVYNRAFFLTPEGKSFFYDKRHLFRMGEEGKLFSAGEKQIIVPYRGWHICLMVCYDLRFPVWSRNVGNQYDLLIYVANWPTSRRKVWDTLLLARALENQCYVCGVNRIGTDGLHIEYNGGSVLHSPMGETIVTIPDYTEGTVTATLDLNKLKQFREKFPVWKDADSFQLQ